MDTSPKPGLDRRAIPQRSARWATAAADALYRLKIRPNHISIFSVVLAGLAGILLGWSSFADSNAARAAMLVGAAVLMPLRLLMNMLDGMLAVEKGLQSPTGDLYNEVPDRVADLLVIAGAGYATVGLVTAGVVDVGVALGWTAAALAVLTAYVRSLGAAQGVKNYFDGPMPKPIRMWVLVAAVLLSLLEPAVGWERGWVLFGALVVIALGSLVTVVMRLRRISAALHGRAS